MCDIWSQGIQSIYIEFYRYLQAIVWNYIDFHIYPWANVRNIYQWANVYYYYYYYYYY